SFPARERKRPRTMPPPNGVWLPCFRNQARMPWPAGTTWLRSPPCLEAARRSARAGRSGQLQPQWQPGSVILTAELGSTQNSATRGENLLEKMVTAYCCRPVAGARPSRLMSYSLRPFLLSQWNLFPSTLLTAGNTRLPLLSKVESERLAVLSRSAVPGHEPPANRKVISTCGLLSLPTVVGATVTPQTLS